MFDRISTNEVEATLLLDGLHYTYSLVTGTSTGSLSAGVQPLSTI